MGLKSCALISRNNTPPILDTDRAANIDFAVGSAGDPVDAGSRLSPFRYA
jgi:hypothetical protein